MRRHVMGVPFIRIAIRITAVGVICFVIMAIIVRMGIVQAAGMITGLSVMASKSTRVLIRPTAAAAGMCVISMLFAAMVSASGIRKLSQA